MGRGTAFNAFVALNMDKVSFDAGGKATIDYGRLSLGSGLLVPPRVTVRHDEESGTYTFSQSVQEPEEGFAVLDDKVYGVLPCHFSQENRYYIMLIHFDAAYLILSNKKKGLVSSPFMSSCLLY